jgi:hypothetical protein
MVASSSTGTRHQEPQRIADSEHSSLLFFPILSLNPGYEKGILSGARMTRSTSSILLAYLRSSKVGFSNLCKTSELIADAIIVDEYMGEVKQLPKAGHVNFFAKALSHLVEPGTTTEDALARTSKLSNKHVGIATWSTTEMAALREYVEQHEDDLEDAPSIVPKRSMAEIVNWFYQEQGYVLRGEQQMGRFRTDTPGPDIRSRKSSRRTTCLGSRRRRV